MNKTLKYILIIIGIIFLLFLLFFPGMDGQSRWNEFFNPPAPRGQNSPPQLVPVK